MDQAFKDSLTTKAFHCITHSYTHVGGVMKYVNERWQIFQDEHANQPWHKCQDITEQKITQEAKVIAEKKARISEQLLF